MSDLVIIKFGGSAITYKNDIPPKINEDIISNAAEDIESYKGNVILVLGGGAHGHQAAHKYGYGDNTTPRVRLLQGVPEIRHNMSLLSSKVEHIFLKNNLGTVVLSPFSFVLMRDGKISSFPTHILRRALDANLMVITHGDVCFDEKRGASILSGDVIISYLARKFDTEKVLLGTNVDGVFAEDPNVNPNAKLITEINVKNKDSVLRGAKSSVGIDVTGGMSLKLHELLKLAERGIEIIIFNLLVPRRLEKLLDGKNVRCTRINI